MRQKVILFLKKHPYWLNRVWKFARFILRIWGFFIPVQQKTMLFCSYGGRKFDDSPRAIYEEICKSSQFNDWRLIWVFVEPEKFQIIRGEKVKIDTIHFFKALLYSRVWVSNSGMDRGIGFIKKNTVHVETWHGTPLKRFCGEEEQGALGGKRIVLKTKLDSETIRCAQSEYDREIFQRVFHAAKQSILLSDLPRNDALLKYNGSDCSQVRKKLGISEKAKIILYIPTFREYMVDECVGKHIIFPFNIKKWEKIFGMDYVFLLHAHYTVSQGMVKHKSDFFKDVSSYPILNDLYAISDLMISDYSSAFFDYSILERPIFCFAYDLDEYKKKRGLYVDLEEVLPCPIDREEDVLIQHILSLQKGEDEKMRTAVAAFRKRFVPNAGHASEKIVEEIKKRLWLGD